MVSGKWYFRCSVINGKYCNWFFLCNVRWCLQQFINSLLASNPDKILMKKCWRREIPPSCVNQLLQLVVQEQNNQGSTMLASWSIVVLLVMFCMTTLVQTIPSCEILIALCVTWKSRAYISALYQNLENSDRTHRKLSYHQTASSGGKKEKKRYLSAESLVKVMRSSNALCCKIFD